MSESMSSPWIRDYLVDVAETYGAQLYNAPVVSKGKKKVQIIDFLTYHEDSYVWAWISDKDFRVSVRISKDAVDQYKSKHTRSIIDCRHSLIFASDYRPMFSPRPLGPKSPGNTTISHISLEIGSVSFMGIGAHVFGNPRDLESDQKMREWILGLRQDGGGGNVLKLRRQQDLEQNKKAPSPPPPSFSVYAPVSQYQTTATPEVSTKPECERPQTFERLYAKRWRNVERDRWKFVAKPEEKESSKQTESSHPLTESRLETTNGLEPCVSEPFISPPRTPLRTPPRRQGTPTDWSPSNRGSPFVRDEANVVVHTNDIEPQDESEILPASSQTPSGEEEHTSGTAIPSDPQSLQPPTPAQRIKPLPFHSPCSSPKKFPRSSPPPVQQLPSPTPPPPSPSLPLLSPPFPEQMSVRRTIQRKVPHPGLPLPRPDPTKQGPVRILVPNSDTSGAGFSQLHSQSQGLSQSQQSQHQLLSCSPGFPSSLAQESKPADSSTPGESGSGNSTTRDTSKMISQPLRDEIDGEETDPAGDKRGSGRANANSREQEESGPARPPAPSTLRIEVLEVGTSDTEEETDELDLKRSSARMTAELVAWSETREELANEDTRLSVTGTDKRSAPRNNAYTSHSVAASAMTNPSTSAHGTNDIPTQASSRTSERLGSQSSMHSLFSDSLPDEPMSSPRASIHHIGRTDDTERETANPAHIPRHDPEAWKEPSFIAKNKGKGKARAMEESDPPSANAGKKRRLSALPEMPEPTRARVASRETETRPTVSGRNAVTLDHVRQEDTETSNLGKIPTDNEPSCSHTKTMESTTPSRAVPPPKPRLANFVACFDRISLDRGMPMPKLDMEECRCQLLTTGWIRRQGDKVVDDGSAYIEEL